MKIDIADRDAGSIGDILRAAKEKGKSAVYCVAGAGNGGLSMAGHLGIMGYEVRLYNRTDSKIAAVRWHGGIDVEGAVEGFGPVALATSDIGEAIRGADVVMVATPSTAHRDLARSMAKHLVDGQIVVLNPGRTGGALEVRKVLLDEGMRARPIIAEAQTFIYAARALSRQRGRIFRIKNGVPLAALPSYWTPSVLDVIDGPFPQFVGGSNVLATSLENIGAIFHPALTIMNAGWIESTGGDFDYYLQGITPSIAKLLQSLDDERLAVARALGIRSVSAREWLYLSYDSPGAGLYEAIQNTTSYAGIKAPPSIEHRYITEDIPMSLVPIASLGAMLGVPTPAIGMVIELGSRLLGRDLRAGGRTVESLGIAGLSVKQIHSLVYDPGEGAPPEQEGDGK
jgi:Glycerol-3-phosphate dehydrogenase